MYATLNDILDAASREDLEGWTGDVEFVDDGEINSATVEAAIRTASSEVDSYCSVRYLTPFDHTPEAIRTVAVDIAIYRLAKRGRFDVPDHILTAYNNAVKWLRDVSAGKANVVGASAHATQAEQAAGSYNADDRDFTKDSMSSW